VNSSTALPLLSPSRLFRVVTLVPITASARELVKLTL
jgi:hypothetical protein